MMSDTTQRAEQYLKWSAQAEQSGLVQEAIMYADAAIALLRPLDNAPKKVAALEDIMCGYVYAMRCEGGSVKIGFTEIVRTRFLAVARKRAKRLSVEDCLRVRHIDMRKVETFAHDCLSPYRITRRGEWFSADADAVRSAFDNAIARFDRARRTDEYQDL